ncbi:hypothetical protein [Candidatus Arthromitus sp. SFB-rat-Yit]|uniref:hypothetical protein n=1 Tax=Candidatus Arthromitus sp. SFB-rat-Yit TaxID=1041504 RepID=UPI000227A786|nr:hypothetical protein [Candidatus Arthromitus sp. SFB-rat-Yit]BAK81746.1 hypothetical protein RATSFB_1184 [Candidatus Arthromitus sp. SFB-rat-Yit]
MNNLKFISLTLGIATTILPFINAQALPMYEDDGKRVVTPLNIFNMENKNLKRNQKEEMSEILVKLYNNYNTLLKRGLEINDVKNSDLYINITNQKINLKELLNNIISYPYTIVNSEIEKNFLESKFSFCYLTKEYIKDENLTRIFNATDITDIKQDLNNVLNSITLSIDIIKTFRGEYNNTYLNDITMYLNSLINNNIYNIDSFNEHKDTIQNLINEVSSSINDILIEYI